MPSSENIDRALAEALLREGTVNQVGIRGAEAHQRRQGTSLEEALLSLELCTERELLRALAKAWRMQYLTHERAEQLRVPDALLERVPVRLAEAHWVVPFRIDEVEILWILTAAPVEEEVLLRLLSATGARAVNRLLVRRATAWAAIRKLYYRDPAAFQRTPRPPRIEEPGASDPQDPFDRADVDTVSKTLRCPSCHAPASVKNFQCRNCGLLLNPDARADEAPSEHSVVRAMMSGGQDAPPVREPGNEGPTLRTELPMDRGVVPMLVAGLDVVERPLHAFEAFVASFVDGETNVVDLARAAELTEVETQAVLRSLAERQIVELQRRPAIKSHVAAALNQMRKAPETAPAKPVAPTEDPETSRAHSVLQEAVALERAGKADEAIGVLKAGITRLRRPAPLLNRLALVLLDQRRDIRGAEELLKKACELEPANEVYSRNLYKVIGMAAVRALDLTGKKR